MNNFLKKIQQIHKELLQENGDFLLFSCVELAVNEDEWDIILCADWLPKRKRLAIDFIFDKLEQVLEEDDFLNISRVVILNTEDSFYQELQKITHPEKEKISNISIAGLYVKQAFILQITSPINLSSTSKETESSHFTKRIIGECSQICNSENIEYESVSSNDEYYFDLKECYYE